MLESNFRVNYLSLKLCFKYKTSELLKLVFIPNRTFLVRFGGISGEFGRAMVRILARRSRAKIPMARPNELSFDICPDIVGYQDSRLGF